MKTGVQQIMLGTVTGSEQTALETQSPLKPRPLVQSMLSLQGCTVLTIPVKMRFVHSAPI